MQTSSVTVRETDRLIVLENDLVAFTFGRDHHGALLSVLDKVTGQDLLRDQHAPRALFRLGLRDPQTMEMHWIESDSASRFSCDDLEEGAWRTLVLTCSFTRPRITAVVRVSLSAESALSNWQMAIQNAGPDSVCRFVCPIISGLVKLGDPAPGEALAVPVQSEGYLFREPYPVRDHLPLCAGDGPESPHVGLGEIHQMYPGALSMQMHAFYNDHAGLYLAAHDSGQHPKSFDMGVLPLAGWEETPALSISHYSPFAPGKSVSFAYNTVVGVFHGDWRDAADIYKAWARKQWWCEKTLWERDIPDWLRNGFGIFQMSNYHIPTIKMNHTLNEIVETVNDLSQEIDTPLAALIFNWEAGGAWTGPIGLFPPREGNTTFKNAMQRLRDSGNHGFVYMPGGAWYLRLPYDPPFDSWKEFDRDARPHAVLDEHGELVIGRWYPGWEVTRTCASTDYAMKLHREVFLGCLKRGVSWVQIDNFPCGGAEACFDLHHDHPPGYGAWWSEAWGNTLRDIRRAAKAVNPDCVMSTEGIAETFIPFLDLYDQRAPNMEYFGHLRAGMPMGGETIPLFGYVYHEYLGGYTAAMPECNRPEVLYWTRCLGKALAEGVVPNGGAYFPEPQDFNPVTLGFYKKVVRAAAHECWPYLMFGEMLRPPAIDSPRITASYLRFNDTVDAMDPRRRHEVEDDAIQRSAWRGRDGSIGYILANVSEDAVETDMELSAYAEVDPDEPRHYRVEKTVDGKTLALHRNTELPRVEHLRLPPLSVMLITVRTAGREHGADARRRQEMRGRPRRA